MYFVKNETNNKNYLIKLSQNIMYNNNIPIHILQSLFYIAIQELGIISME